MKVSTRVRISGSLRPYAKGFAASLTAQGYTDLSLANQLRLLADLSRWLKRRALHKLTSEVVGRFLARRRRTHTVFRSLRALAPLLEYLRALGVIPIASLVDETFQDETLRRYAEYLCKERALAASVRTAYLAVAGAFLEARDSAGLTRADVVTFVRDRAKAPGFPTKLSALRSVLRFLFLSGETPIDLTYSVPTLPCWRLTSLPRALEQAQVDAALACCDRRTTVGRRDHAVLVLMVRLGLRASDVATLTLDDIDWIAGELVVRGKGKTISRLPLPVDVGEALTGYLSRRRPTETRSVFLQARAPYRAATASTIVGIAGRILRSTGVSGGGHRLRHTAATQMLQRGASLTEIAQVLRHRHVDTTAIYAKVDRHGLQTVAHPWPQFDTTSDRCALESLAQPWPGGVA